MQPFKMQNSYEVKQWMRKSEIFTNAQCHRSKKFCVLVPRFSHENNKQKMQTQAENKPEASTA